MSKDHLFEVVLTGEVLLGEEFAQAWDAFVQTFKLDAQQAEALLLRLPATIKKGVDRESAELYAQRIRDLGLVVNVTRLQAPEPVPAAAAPIEASADLPVVENAWSLTPMESDGRDESDSARGGENIHELAPSFSVVDTLPKSSAASVENSRPLAFGFSGNGGEYFRIWIVNLLLSIVTLGIYSAWAKVRRLNYFHGNTWLGDANFAYHAKPLQILKGRVVAFVLFALLAFGSQINPLVGVGASLLFMLVFPWMFWTSMRFRAANTSYRNIRFGFRGSLGGAYAALLGWPLLGLLTLGILFPMALHRTTHYAADNLAYGTARFSFMAGPGRFYGLFLKYLGLLVLLALVAGGVVFGGGGFTPESAPSSSAHGPAVAGAMIISYLGFFVLYAWYQTRFRNLVLNHVQLAGHALQSRYTVGSYMALQLGNWLGIVATLGLFIPWAAVRTARYAAEHTALALAGDLNGFVADQAAQSSALGQEMGDMFDADISLI